MSNTWDIRVTSCADCPLRRGSRCAAWEFMPYLAQAKRPDECPLDDDMRIVLVGSDPRACRRCGGVGTECPRNVAYRAMCFGTITEEEWMQRSHCTGRRNP